MITLISDYGPGSPYSAALRGKLLTLFPQEQVLEISNQLVLGDIRHAAFLIGESCSYYPAGSIHLLAVACSPVKYKQIGILYTRHQYIVAFDNGIFEWLPVEAQDEFYTFDFTPELEHKTFAELDVFPEVVQRIRQNPGTLNRSGSLPVPQNFLRKDSDKLWGNVIFIDSNANIITDITKDIFTDYANRYPRFAIYYRGKGNINRIHTHYDDGIQPGETVAFFNFNNRLEIAQNHGNASSLLGVKTGDRIIIEFYDK